MKKAAFLLAVGIALAGWFVKMGIDGVVNSSRTVTVKGLAEMEVPADKVMWPLSYTLQGNDLPTLYAEMQRANAVVTDFLKRNGILEAEISTGAPKVTDSQADSYRNVQPAFRYKLTAVITVTSDQVELVKKLITSQGELLKHGIAVSTGTYPYFLEYEYTGLNDVKPQMIEEATRNARAAAEKFAADSGSKLGAIKQANQGQFSITDRDAYTPNIKKIRVVTTVVYSLED